MAMWMTKMLAFWSNATSTNLRLLMCSIFRAVNKSAAAVYDLQMNVLAPNFSSELLKYIQRISSTTLYWCRPRRRFSSRIKCFAENPEAKTPLRPYHRSTARFYQYFIQQCLLIKK